RRLPERGLAQPLPVLLRLRQHQGSYPLAIPLEDGSRSCHGRDCRQDLASGGRVRYPLSCGLRASPLGAHDEEGRPDRTARLLPDLWWWLELMPEWAARAPIPAAVLPGSVCCGSKSLNALG